MTNAMPITITEDTPCIQCGYNLRGLSSDGRCPECNALIDQSQRGDLLKYANPQWLRKIKLGVDLMYYGIVVVLLVGLFVGVLSVVFASSFGRSGSILEIALQILGTAFHLPAVFLLSTQEPRTLLSESGFTWRRFIRFAALAGVLLQIMIFVSAFQSAGALLVVLTLALGVTGFITLFGEFTYAHSFALRIPDPKLAKSTTIVKWGLSIIMLLLAIVVVLGMMVATSAPPLTAPASAPATISSLALAIAFGLSICAGCITYLVFVLWACRLLWRYRKALRAAHDEACTSAAQPPVDA